uniref:Uncharacterized protein n=1 Tax=Schizaphis graminum TaxID=13262 RepID=A0A2S2NVQ4_SCHGA
MAQRKYDDKNDDLVNHKKELKQSKNTLKKTSSSMQMLMIPDSSGSSYFELPVFTRVTSIITNEVTETIQDVANEISTENDISEKITNININSPEIAVKEGSRDVNIDSSTMTVDEVNDTLQ